jgi:hypothetical protein
MNGMTSILASSGTAVVGAHLRLKPLTPKRITKGCVTYSFLARAVATFKSVPQQASVSVVSPVTQLTQLAQSANRINISAICAVEGILTDKRCITNRPSRAVIGCQVCTVPTTELGRTSGFGSMWTQAARYNMSAT